jgi:hypothetical protein
LQSFGRRLIHALIRSALASLAVRVRPLNG